MNIRSAILLVVLVFLNACGAPEVNKFDTTPSRPSDAAFQKLVEAKMPGYVLTSAILGRAVRPSDGYSLEVTTARDRPDDRSAVSQDFIKRFETTGAKPFVIYFPAGSAVPSLAQYWRMEFPGCQPQECVDKIDQSKFSRVSIDEYENYYFLSSKTRFFTRDIVSAKIDGINYVAELYVSFDARGRVMKYRVSSYREALTSTERARARQVGTERKLRVPTFRFVRNLALSSQAETWNPSYFGGDGVDVLRGL